MTSFTEIGAIGVGLGPDIAQRCDRAVETKQKRESSSTARDDGHARERTKNEWRVMERYSRGVEEWVMKKRREKTTSGND